MAHTIQNKQKLLNRVRRIKGQLEGVEKALQAEQDCSKILNTIAASRGALNGLFVEVLEGHIESHVLNPNAAEKNLQQEAGTELIELLRRYLK